MQLRAGLSLLGLIAAFAAACGGSGSGGLSEAEIRAIVAAEDRSPQDRETDARRHPVEFLRLTGVARGDRVADIGAGGGYTAELLARAVGPEGTIYGHNTPRVIEKYVGESWPARLTKPVNARIVRVDRDFQDPLPEGTSGLDLITMVFVYHDAPLYDVDRAAFNRNLFAALRPGGALILVDHHAAAGAPVDETAATLHRIDEAVVKRELEAAGFQLEESANFLRNPDDPCDAPFFQMEQPTDAFVHRWVKPASADG